MSAPGEGWPPDDLEHVGECPACRAASVTRLYASLHDPVYSAPGSWNVWRCTACGSVYLNPRPTPQSIGRAYETYFTHESPEREPEPAGRIGALRRALLNGHLNAHYGYRLAPSLGAGGWLLARLPQTAARIDKVVRHLHWGGDGHRVLDVGCGNGDFLLRIRELGWEPHGVDPDTRAVESARAAGLSVARGTIDDVDPEGAKYAAVTLSHVIEHLHDPRRALARAHALLSGGGMLWVATPNAESIGHRTFGRHWFGLDPPRHLMVLSRRALGALLREAGFWRVRALPAPADARWLFGPSEAIAEGARPDGMPAPSSPAVRLKAALATAVARHRSDRAEELIFAAWKREP